MAAKGGRATRFSPGGEMQTTATVCAVAIGGEDGTAGNLLAHERRAAKVWKQKQKKQVSINTVPNYLGAKWPAKHGW